MRAIRSTDGPALTLQEGRVDAASALGLAGFRLMTLGLWLKARLEEEFLMRELGAAAYGDYKARTPMLVPRVLDRRT